MPGHGADLGFELLGGQVLGRSLFGGFGAGCPGESFYHVFDISLSFCHFSGRKREKRARCL